MKQPTLPVPDAEGVYTFPTDLARAHDDYQHALDQQQSRGDTTMLEVVAPYGGRRYLVPQRRPTGRQLVALEPHHDQPRTVRQRAAALPAPSADFSARLPEG